VDALCIFPTLVLLKGQVLKQEIGSNEDVRDKQKGCEKNTRKQREGDYFRIDCVANNFFVIPFYLQSVLVHSANCVKTCMHVYSGM
jgi:hypothetical protein